MIQEQAEKDPARLSRAVVLAASGKSEIRIVSMGGGTGLSTLLSGLKTYSLKPPSSGQSVPLNPQNVHAIVTVTDDGGSSGRLRRELNIIPPGDLRNCMVALAKDELLMTRLFRYRFAGTGHLRGHSFGNLFLTALSHITGDLMHALELTSEVLAIQGKILPATTENIHLQAELADGRIVSGETAISHSSIPIRRVRLDKPRCAAVPAALKAIRHADVITLGPGSLFTSVIPCLLVNDIHEAVSACRAVKVFICNIMTQPGETTDMSAADHVQALLEHVPKLKLDYIIANRSTFSASTLRRYRRRHAEPVDVDRRELARFGARVLLRNLARQQHVVRHDPERLARCILGLVRNW